MTKVLFRVALLLGAVVYLAYLGSTLAGQWKMKDPTPENLEGSLGWDSSNPTAWILYARHWHFQAANPEIGRAVDGYKKAISLNLFDPVAWKELTTVHIEQEDMDQAEASLRGEIAVFPHSPQVSWRMANFLLVRGKTAEAYPYLRGAANERTLLVPVFDLSHRLEADPDVIRQQLVPETPVGRAAYLQFLISRQLLENSYPVWQDITRNWTPEDLRLGNVYVGSLASAGIGGDARRVWGDLLTLTGRENLRPEGEFLTNGDFEGRISNTGLGWRLRPGEGYQVALDAFMSQNGAQSLRVTFDGTTNTNFAGVYQFVPVEPNRRYRFESYLRTENITTDSGLYLVLVPQGAPREESFVLTTAKHVETMGWVREQLDFETGPRTSVILVQLRRLPSQRLNNLIRGKVWIDHLSLKLRES